MRLRGMKQLPTICYICKYKLFPHPLYNRSVAVFCPDHGDFFLQKFNDRPSEVVWRSFPEEKLTLAEIKDSRYSSRTENYRVIRCNETGVVYGSVHQAARAMGLQQASIQRVLSGKHSHAGGFTFSDAHEGEQWVETEKRETASRHIGYAILCVEKNIVYPSIRTTGEALGLCRESIRLWLNQSHLNTSKYTFVKVEE